MDNNTLIVKNAEGEPDTQAQIIIQNKIGYTPKVSVIIPVYNTEKYLRECMDSVINQTLKEIEIICVDDGSTDGSLEILKEYAKKDERITVITQENLHAGVARNAGLSVARGEYVHFLDSDDWVDLDTYERLYSICIDKKVNFAKFKSYTYDNQLKEIINSNFTDMVGLTESFVVSIDIQINTAIGMSDAPWSGIYSLNFLNVHNIRFDCLICANDSAFYFRCLFESREFYFINDKFVYYRVNNNKSLVGIRPYNFDCQIQLYYNIKKIIGKESDKIKELMEKRFSYAILSRVKNYLQDNSIDEKTKNNIRYLSAKFYQENSELSDKLVFENFLTEDVCSNSNIKISVIVPVYNTEKYLHECLDSIINQTLKEIEIICVDDGSTDSSQDILKMYASKDSRIRAYQQNHKKAGAARNLGVQLAQGKYIYFIDSDDWIDLNCLRKLYNKIEETHTDICIYGANRYDEAIKQITPSSYSDMSCFRNRTKEICDFRDIKNQIFTRTGPVYLLYDRKFFIDNNLFFQTEIVIGEDVITHVKCLILAKKISFLDENLYYYRVNRTGSSMASSVDSDNVFDVFSFLNETEKFLIDNKLYNELESQFVNYVIDQFCFYINKIQHQDNKYKFIIRALDFISHLSFSCIVNSAHSLKLKEILKTTNIKFNSENQNATWLLKRLSVSVIIPVILSSDDNYAPYMYVTMYSALENAMPDTFYDFYLLVPSAFSKRNTDLIMELKEKYNCDIHFIDMKNAFADLTMHIPHVTSPTYYRLLAGDLLPKEYDKCIYLDVDVCVCRDLASLYNIDMGSNYIAGVVAAAYYLNQESHCKRLGLPSMEQYVNAGVLLMNLKQIRQDGMTARFVELSKNDYSSQDQDVINVACYGRILTLPVKYNVMTKYKALFDAGHEQRAALEEIYGAEHIGEGVRSPVIVHYADKIKPWNDVSMKMMGYWWKYAQCLENNEMTSNNKAPASSPLLYKDIGLGCNTWCAPQTVSGNAYTYDLSDNIYTRYVSWDPIKEGSCDVEILRLSAVEKRSGRVVEFPVDKIISSGKITGSKVEFRNQKCWIGCAVEGAYESFTVEAVTSLM